MGGGVRVRARAMADRGRRRTARGGFVSGASGAMANWHVHCSRWAGHSTDEEGGAGGEGRCARRAASVIGGGGREGLLARGRRWQGLVEGERLGGRGQHLHPALEPHCFKLGAQRRGDIVPIVGLVEVCGGGGGGRGGAAAERRRGETSAVASCAVAPRPRARARIDTTRSPPKLPRVASNASRSPSCPESVRTQMPPGLSTRAISAIACSRTSAGSSWKR